MALGAGAATAIAAATGGSGGAGLGGGSNSPGAQGAADAVSSAATQSGAAATAQSTSTGASGGAHATARTRFQAMSVQSTATAQADGGAATTSAVASAGGSGRPFANPGQSAYAFAVGAPNKAYAQAMIGGANKIAAALLRRGASVLGIVGLGANDTEAGASDSYRATATFGLSPPGDLVLGLISDQMSGFTGPSDFRSVEFSIASNGTEIADSTFSSLATAQGFFDDRIIDLGSIAGPGVDLTFSYDLIANGPGGFGVDFAFGAPSAAASTSNFVVAAPEPSTWAMMLAGFVGLGLAGYRRARC